VKRFTVVAAIALIGPFVLAAPAQAESCSKSRDYILSGSAELSQSAQRYRELYRQCMSTLELSNVQDAFVLQVGAIGVIPRRDDIAGTASTLAQFCERFPRGILHFVERRQRAQVASTSLAVRFSAVRPNFCQKIKGGG
jgi:hypothetical protein